MKIGIIGTRGIPNHYGGFEQASEYLSTGLAAKGHEVMVYCSHNHPYQENSWNGIQLIRCKDPEYYMKMAGQFFYDFNCIRDARNRNFDVLLFMGYTSSSVWSRYFPKKTIIISNMDGIEWKRQKYSWLVQRFLQYAEGLAIKHSHFHIADSEMIKKILDEKYRINCTYIPYGACHKLPPENNILEKYKLTREGYFLLMARMEPENNIETILSGFVKCSSEKKMVVIGNMNNRYGRMIENKFAKQGVIFTGPVFNQSIVSSLRANCYLYFHGHSVGGTNPSLIEAMADRILIAAHDNIFNRHILKDDAYYFSCAEDVRKIMNSVSKDDEEAKIENNIVKITREFNWTSVLEGYNNLIESAVIQSYACDKIK
ncbi:MAG: DUF1972 domain-containing protein [Flavisolibacter sp.]|jgi:hypothetical protein|nr:DUF1972 domain-containing protein [Flavisolibacter sp.]